ncbi:MAG: hypothetical protein FWH22_08315, partial [Fibromonadales bacterium]|nr:hypothetical protein [Fibromonadales bacterium]
MRVENYYVNSPLPEENLKGGEKELETKTNSQPSALNSQLTFDNRASAKLDTEKLKLINEISRLILELKNKFPELAQDLSKARDNISANQENIPVKKLLKLLEAIQQNLNAFTDKSLPALKLAIAETIKISHPSPEIPLENKLILALSKNDFISAVATALQIVSQATQSESLAPATATAQTPPSAQTSPQSFQIIFNALQELKEMGIPRELQNAPLKELETIALQKTGIEIPKDLSKNLSAVFNEKPVFAIVATKTESIVLTPLIDKLPLQMENKPSFEIPLPPKQSQKLPQAIPQK